MEGLDLVGKYHSIDLIARFLSGRQQKQSLIVREFLKSCYLVDYFLGRSQIQLPFPNHIPLTLGNLQWLFPTESLFEMLYSSSTVATASNANISSCIANTPFTPSGIDDSSSIVVSHWSRF